MPLRAAVAVLLLTAACAGDSEPTPPAQRGRGLVAQVASYEPLVGDDNRLIVGLLTEDNLFVSGGTATFRLAFLGEQGGVPQEAGQAEATFLPILEPGVAQAPPRPSVGSPSQVGRGVYSAEDVTFHEPGAWQVEVEVAIDGRLRRATAAFTVLPEPVVPAVGEEAPRTKNLTVDSAEAPPEAIDSRAATEGEIPDPELHATTIANLIERKHPFLAVFATPVFCVSRFCGPITDMVAGLAEAHPDIGFVHVEIWRDFDNQVVNKAAAEWVQTPDGGLTEPWIFLVGEDGRIVARWDNVATPQEIEPRLRDLPSPQ
ncbi:MAG TPA: hypothetical protein VE575_15710 [Acidimicrobiales bacterium]|jgi:hypothetical protein|nr:hypothetical protein [Acidimicrobiales bacterium]